MSSGKCSITADFLEHQGRKLFYLLLQPNTVKPHSTILYLPPFAEEMHKSRRIVASQARELAAAGFNVMLLDLTGCGDASGDFVDASWQIWLEDANFAMDSLTTLVAGPLMLWGLRLGALLACELSQSRSDVHSLVLWQPVLNGEQQIDQFLRLRTAASAVNGVQAFDRKSLWNELRAGHSLEIAGYELSSAMALELARSRLIDHNPGGFVNWIEIGNLSKGGLSVGNENVIAHWRERGLKIDYNSVQGEPFWRVVDAPVNLDLQRSTLKCLTQQ